jgi:hypothetical protein
LSGSCCKTTSTCALREEQALPAGGEARRVEGRGRIERGHERMLATVFGTVTVRRLAYRAPGRPNVCPADAALSLPAGRHSHGLRRLAVCEAVRGSYDTAKAAIDRRCGRVAGKRQLEQPVQAAADIDGFYARRVPVPCTREVLLVLSADGKGIVMRPEGLRPASGGLAGLLSDHPYARSLGRFGRTVTLRYRALLSELDASPADTHGQIVAAMISGDIAPLEAWLDARHGPGSFARMFRAPSFVGEPELVR